MTTEDKSGNFNTAVMGALIAPARSNVREAVDTAKRLQESVSRLVEGNQRFYEMIIAMIEDATGEPGITDAEALKNGAENNDPGTHNHNNGG